MMDFIKKFVIGFLVFCVPVLIFASIYFFLGQKACVYSFFGLAYTIVAVLLCWLLCEIVMEEINDRKKKRARREYLNERK